MKNYFNFSRKDKIGTLLLSFSILALVVILNVGAVRELPDPFVVNPDALSYFDNIDGLNDDREIVQMPVYEVFNPNELSFEGWMELGFSEKQAKSIVKYKNLKGGFTNKDQLREVYVISEAKYLELESFVRIPKSDQFKSETHTVVELKDDEILEDPVEKLSLNLSTKEELMTIKGIGPFFADKIIKFRNNTGGFIDEDQIEKLTISEDAKLALNDNVFIDADEVRKTNVNSATKKQLKAIPFSNWLVVTRIMKMRDQIELTNLDFLTKEEISDLDFAKMLLYIEF